MGGVRLPKNPRLCHPITVGAGSARPLYFKEVFNLTAFVVYLFCSLSLCSFWAQKERKTPGTRVEQVAHSSAHISTLTTPPYRIPCGANYVCTTHDYMLAGLSICKANSFVARLPLVSAVPISGTKELASRTPCIVWHTRSDTFVLVPLLERTRAVAQTVPVFFLILPFVGGLSCAIFIPLP